MAGGGDRPRLIRQGDRCEVSIGRELVLTGYVDATPIRWDAKEIAVAVSGRSLTADLVDCGADNKPGQWRNQSVLRIVQALAQPYGIAVRSELEAGGALAEHTIKPGETVFESIDRLLRLSRLLSTDDARGQLVIARPGSAGRAADRLEHGVNLINGDAPLDFSKVYSEYVAKGQRAGTDDVYGVDASEIEARVSDDRVTRKRVLVLHERGQMTPELARQRVAWERENRISKALQTSYEVRGWRQSNGALWRHNQIVRVVDPLVGFDRDLLITEIEYSLSEKGAPRQRSPWRRPMASRQSRRTRASAASETRPARARTISSTCCRLIGNSRNESVHSGNDRARCGGAGQRRPQAADAAASRHRRRGQRWRRAL